MMPDYMKLGTAQGEDHYRVLRNYCEEQEFDVDYVSPSPSWREALLARGAIWAYMIAIIFLVVLWVK